MNSPRVSNAKPWTTSANEPAAQAWEVMGEFFFNHARPRAMEAHQALGLSPPQGVVLRMLDQPRPMGELAHMMRCDNSNMTGIIDRLEERDLVRRIAAPGDRRVKLIELTDRGEEVHGEISRLMAEPPPQLKSLPREDLEALRDIVARALDVVDSNP